MAMGVCCAVAAPAAAAALRLPARRSRVSPSSSSSSSSLLSSRRRRGAGSSVWCNRTRAMAAEESTSVANDNDAAGDADEDFEARLQRLSGRTGSGKGKKAEKRKGSGGEGVAVSAASSSPASPPMSSFVDSIPNPLKLEPPTTKDGLPVELGFNPLAERLNGRFAMVGLAAVILIELFSGDTVYQLHQAGTLAAQVYLILGGGAIMVKLQRERTAVWPKD